jgi:hypothetical protein
MKAVRSRPTSAHVKAGPPAFVFLALLMSCVTVDHDAEVSVTGLPSNSNPCGLGLEPTSGDGQTGDIGAPLPLPVAVHATYKRGSAACTERAATNMPIVWKIRSGGGIVASETTYTDAAGDARVIWTLGPTAGQQEVGAVIPPPGENLPPVVVFSATARDKPYRILRIVAGNGLRVDPGNGVIPDVQLVSHQPDGTDVPVPNTTVTWQVTSGGGSVSPSTSLTSANGRASATWTPGPATGAQTLRATAGTSTGIVADARDLLIANFTATIATNGVASVTVTGPTTLVAGAGGAYTAEMRDASGTVLTDRTASWTVTPAELAVILPTGNTTAGVAAHKVGTARIVATSEGVQGALDVQITPGAVATVNVTPPTASINLGSNQTFTATAFDAEANVVPNQTYTWSSSNPAVAGVVGGVATSLSVGQVTITAAIAAVGKSGTATLTVVNPPAPPPVTRIAYARFDAASIANGTANQAFAFNSLSNGSVHLERLSLGRYDVTFPGQATLAGRATNVQVSGFGSANADFCKLESWRNAGPDLVATVRCFRELASVDGEFTILMLGDGVLPGRFAFGYYDSGFAADALYSSSGITPSVAAGSQGFYTVSLPALGRPTPASAELVAVTAGGAAATRCAFGSDENSLICSSAPVWCHSGVSAPVGIPAASPFSFLLFENGRTGLRAGLAATTGFEDTPIGTVSTLGAAVSRNSSGLGVSLRHVSTGNFAVTFAGLGGQDVRLGVHVTSASLNGDHCKVAGWQSVLGAGNQQDLVVNVACFETDGTPEDQGFRLMVVQ